jgi:hypothetical protein
MNGLSFTIGLPGLVLVNSSNLSLVQPYRPSFPKILASLGKKQNVLLLETWNYVYSIYAAGTMEIITQRKCMVEFELGVSTLYISFK